MMKDELCEKMVEVWRVSDRVMTVVVVFDEDVLRLTCGYAQQSARSLDKKQSFYDELKCEWYMHSADDLLMCLGEFNGNVGRHIDGFNLVHVAYDEGQSNLEGRMSLEFCLKKELCVLDTWHKMEERRKVTFRMSKNETEVDLVLIKKRTLTVYSKWESNPCGISTCLNDSRYR